MDRFLYANEELYHNLINSAPHLITSINKDGKIIDCNDKISEILGYKKGEIIGNSMLDLVHPSFRSKAIESWNGGYLKDFTDKKNFKMICKNGSEIDVLVSLKRIQAADQDESIRIWVIEEASKHPHNEKKISKKGASADVYLDILSHDIKNLTQAITTQSELLLMKPNLSVQYKKYFETTMHHSQTIRELLSNVRHLSQLKNNDFEVKDIDVFKTLASAIDKVQQNNPHRSIKVNQGISETEVIVKSNKMLEYAFINIINNVLKYEKHSEVSIDIIHTQYNNGSNSYWKLEFKDFGPGVPDPLKNKIFHDFEIGNEFNHGSGLGLTLVKEIVTTNGGKVWVEDRVEGDFKQGSNFVLLIPKSD